MTFWTYCHHGHNIFWAFYHPGHFVILGLNVIWAFWLWAICHTWAFCHLGHFNIQSTTFICWFSSDFQKLSIANHLLTKWNWMLWLVTDLRKTSWNSFIRVLKHCMLGNVDIMVALFFRIIVMWFKLSISSSLANSKGLLGNSPMQFSLSLSGKLSPKILLVGKKT